MEIKDKKDYINILAIINRFFRYIKTYWSIVLLAACILAGVLGALSIKPSTVTYSSSIAFSYGIKINSDTEYNYTLTGLYAVNTGAVSGAFEELLNTSLFREKLKERLDTDSLSASLSVSFAQNTNLGTLSSVSGDREEAVNILTAALEVLPDVARPVIGPIEIHIQGEAEPVQETVSSPSIAPMIITGFAAGLFLGIGILSLFTLLRHEICSEEDIVNYLQMTLLGSIPYLHAKGSIPFLTTIRQKWLLLKTKTRPKQELIKTDSYRTYLKLMSARISQILREKQIRSLIVMSTKPGEGKTFISEALYEEFSQGGWDIQLVRDLDDFKHSVRNQSDNGMVIYDSFGITSDLETMEAADIADASLLVIKNDTDRAEDIKWGMHFLKKCRAECIGTVLNFLT